MAKYIVLSAIDRDGKPTKTRIKAKGTAVVGEVSTLAGAVDGITRSSGFGGVMTEETVGIGASDVLPTDGDANRGVKWLVKTSYLDVDGNSKTTQNLIGIADHSLLVAGQDKLDITAGVGLAFKNAWEQVFLSPDNTVGTLVEVVQVTVTD